MINGLPLAVTVVVEVFSAAVGTTGMLAEYTTKLLNKEKYPTLRKICELFSKTLQNGAAAFSLVILGSLAANPACIIVAGTIGAVMVLTPVMRAAFQNSDHPSLKKALILIDNIANIAAKTINMAMLTGGVYLALGVPAAMVAGLGLGTLSIVTYRKV